MTAEGRPGGLLVVGDFPSVQEDHAGAPFWGVPGRLMRSTVAKFWDGPVVYDYAVKCRAGTIDAGVGSVEVCRRYLAGTYAEGAFERVIVVGGIATLAVLGRTVAPLSARRGYAYASDGTPVFILVAPAAAMQNRFLRAHFEADLGWALTAKPPRAPLGAMARVLETREDAEMAAAELRGGFSFDAEWSGLIWDAGFDVLSVAFAGYGADHAYVWDGRRPGAKQTLAPLAEILEDDRVPKSGWNVKGDVSALACGLGIEVRGIDADAMIWRKQIESEVDANLEVAQELVGMGGGKREIEDQLVAARAAISAARRSGHIGALPGMREPWVEKACRRPDAPPDAFAYGGVERDVLLRYNALDALSTARLVELLRPRHAALGWAVRTWRGLLQPAIRTLTRIERRGMKLDLDMLAVFDRHLLAEQQRVEAQLFQRGAFNPDSGPQLRKFLYTDLGLPILKHTASGAPSCDAEVLRELSKINPVVGMIAERKKYATFRSRYSQGMRQHVRADERVHTRFSLGEVRSLRLSSRDPNMQNQASRDKELAKFLKDCFVAAPGHVLISIDFSQIEYRVAAMLSNDPVFRQVFLDGHDLHRRTAELIAPHVWKIRPEDVRSEHRYLSKNVNFGVLFGMSVGSLAKFIGVKYAVAEAVHTAVMSQFSWLRRWIQDQISSAHRRGEVFSYWMGEPAHRRDLYNIGDVDDERRVNAEHIAVNHPVQGSAALYTLAALTLVDDWLVGDAVPAQIVNTVHDEILIEARDDVAREVGRTAGEIMERQWMDGVPVVVDREYGRAWGSMVSEAEFFEKTR
jgi:DNA polymerase-1